MDEKILEKVARLLKVYGFDEHKIEGFMNDLKDDKEDELEDILEDEEDEEEYNEADSVMATLGRDVDLNKDKALKELLDKKYSK